MTRLCRPIVYRGIFLPFLLLRRLYEWVISWAEHRLAIWALFVLSFAEASFFPIPPDVLLIAMAIGKPTQALRFAFFCTSGSLLGSLFGYLLGYQFYVLIGKPIIDLYAVADQYEKVQNLFEGWNALAVAVAGFTPIPFKVFTIASGAFKVNLLTFFLAAAVSRAARFFIIAVLIYHFGTAIQEKIDRYFNQLTVLFILFFVGGFLLLKYVL